MNNPSLAMIEAIQQFTDSMDIVIDPMHHPLDIDNGIMDDVIEIVATLGGPASPYEPPESSDHDIKVDDLLLPSEIVQSSEMKKQSQNEQDSPGVLLAASLQKRQDLLKKSKDKQKHKKKKPQFRYSRHGKLSAKAHRNSKKKYSYHRW